MQYVLWGIVIVEAIVIGWLVTRSKTPDGTAEGMTPSYRSESTGRFESREKHDAVKAEGGDATINGESDGAKNP